MSSQTPKQKNNQLLLSYAGLGTQLLVAIALAVWGGIQLDKQMNTGFPLLVWLLPLVVIAGNIYKIVKDTTPKK